MTTTTETCRHCGVNKNVPPREHPESCHVRKNYEGHQRQNSRRMRAIENQVKRDREEEVAAEPTRVYFHRAQDWLKDNSPLFFQHFQFGYRTAGVCALAEYLAQQDGHTFLKPLGS